MKVGVKFLNVCLSCGLKRLCTFLGLGPKACFQTEIIHNSCFFLSFFFFRGLFLVSLDCPMIQQWYEFTCSYSWNGMLIGRTRRLKHHRNGGERSQRWGNIYSAWHTWPLHQYKKNMFLSIQSIQTVRTVSVLEMAQREGVCQGGGGWGCDLTASYVWLFQGDCLDPSYVLHRHESGSEDTF